MDAEVEGRHNINQVAGKLGLSASTLRKYEEDYQLIFPRDELNRRYFTEKEIQVLRNIQAMKNEGLNIHAIKKILERSVDLQDQKEQVMELVTLDKLTAADFREFLAKNIAEIMAEKEQQIMEQHNVRIDQMQQEFTVKLEEIGQELGHQRQQHTDENQLLMSENKALLDELQSIKQEQQRIERDKQSRDEDLMKNIRMIQQEQQKKSWWQKIFGGRS